MLIFNSDRDTIINLDNIKILKVEIIEGAENAARISADEETFEYYETVEGAYEILRNIMEAYVTGCKSYIVPDEY